MLQGNWSKTLKGVRQEEAISGHAAAAKNLLGLRPLCWIALKFLSPWDCGSWISSGATSAKDAADGKSAFEWKVGKGRSKATMFVSQVLFQAISGFNPHATSVALCSILRRMFIPLVLG